MIFSKSARESHTLPPAKLLWQNSTGLSSGLRLRSAFESFHRTPCRLASPCLFQLGNSQKFLSVHSTLPIPFGSNFLTLALHRFSVDGITLHRFSVDGSSRPFQSTRFRYSCKCNWMLWLSLCAFGTRTWTLYSPFDIADNLSCGGKSWCAFDRCCFYYFGRNSLVAGSSMCSIVDLQPTAVLGTSSKLSNPAVF